MHKRGRAAAWSLRGAIEAQEPITPCAFEELLRRLAITEADAAGNLAVREWCRRHWRRHFVPVKILQAFQLDTEE